MSEQREAFQRMTLQALTKISGKPKVKTAKLAVARKLDSMIVTEGKNTSQGGFDKVLKLG